jgi:phosphoribosylaminoimidazole-succinocarboxamide synthase
MNMSKALLTSDIPGIEPRKGKVRDVYEFGDRLLFVASDRISAFDWILGSGIPDKGRVLTQVSKFWFDRIDAANHVISMDPRDVALPAGTDLAALTGRSMVVKKTKVVPIECVARGYLIGSGWKEYQANQEVCGIPLPTGLLQASQLPEPIFTPATKAESGHDINISFDEMVSRVGLDLSEKLRRLTLQIYQSAAEHALTKGIIIADTKFEFGILDGEIILIDEVLTPDSSRFWPADQYEPGCSPFSYDKQFVRDWLETTDWDKNSPPPAMPNEIVQKTRDKYIEVAELITGTDFDWK